MKKFFNGRNIAIAIFTLAIGTFVAFGAAKLFFNSSTTVSGNVVSFILNPEGRVEGAILDTGDQIKFGAETGEFVAANLQVGAPLTATGSAGSRSTYGREFKARTLKIGEQTVTISGRGHRGKEDKPGKGKKPHGKGERGKPRNGEKPLPNGEISEEIAPDANFPQAETATVSGTVKHVLVNKDGNPRGLILAGGEQFKLGRIIEDAELSFDTSTNVSATGEIAKSDFGSFIKAKVLTIGDQTFTFDR